MENIKAEIIINIQAENLKFNYKKQEFTTSNYSNVMKYLKGMYMNKERFKSRFLNKLPSELFHNKEKYLLDYEMTVPFTYKEAFELENQEFQANVFGTIDIVEMIAELGHERIKVEGKLVKRKQFAESGEFLGYKEYDNIYETHRVFGEKLGLDNDSYAVKCWCTSTDKEHWLWIEDKYKDNPLEAIASTFRFHENVIPNIKELKRQGDIMLVEMKEEVEPKGEIVPLTKEQYFDLLTTET